MKYCGIIEDILARFIHGEVLLHEREELENHIAMCASCERLYRDVTGMDRALRNLPGKLVDPPAYLHARIMANLPESRPGAAFGAAWVRWAAAAGGAVAVALLAVALVRTVAPPKARVASAPATKPAPAPTAVPGAAAPLPGAVSKPPAGAGPARPAEDGLAVASAPQVKIVKEVKIYFYCPSARKVAMTGDFNGWESEGVPLKRAGKPGFWTAELRLPPGAYSYNFIVDGEVLVPDPNSATQMPDGYGGTDSILLVRDGDSA